MHVYRAWGKTQTRGGLSRYANTAPCPSPTGIHSAARRWLISAGRGAWARLRSALHHYGDRLRQETAAPGLSEWRAQRLRSWKVLRRPPGLDGERKGNSRQKQSRKAAAARQACKSTATTALGSRAHGPPGASSHTDLPPLMPEGKAAAAPSERPRPPPVTHPRLGPLGTSHGMTPPTIPQKTLMTIKGTVRPPYAMAGPAGATAEGSSRCGRRGASSPALPHGRSAPAANRRSPRHSSPAGGGAPGVLGAAGSAPASPERGSEFGLRVQLPSWSGLVWSSWNDGEDERSQRSAPAKAAVNAESKPRPFSLCWVKVKKNLLQQQRGGRASERKQSSSSKVAF